MNIQWYPGHMTKARRMMTEDIKLIDVVVELLDARVPFSSKNPDIDSIAGNKSRVVVLNKSDLADRNVTEKWQLYFEEKGFFTATVNAKSGAGIRSITDIIREACKEKIERDRKRGIINRPVRAMIVGIPNVGKSTFINSYAKKACTKTGNKPGVTKGKQWIRLNKDVELLDTPGILWPKFDNQDIGISLALIGSIREEILNTEELSLILLKKLKEFYPDIIKNKLSMDCADDDLTILMEFAKNRGCLQKGGELDLTKASSLLLDDFRNGKLGYISLEKPDIINSWHQKEDIMEDNIEDKTNKFFNPVQNSIFKILLFCIAFSIIAGIIISTFFVQHTKVHGISMQYTLRDGDIVLVNKFTYFFNDPQRFDIILFKSDSGEYCIKRIIGMPGEKVQIKDGVVYIDGKHQDDNYYYEMMNDAGIAKDEITLDYGEYFVLGDNRNESIDSRDNTIGIVDSKNIIGKIYYKIYPFINSGEIDNDANLYLRNN